MDQPRSINDEFDIEDNGHSFNKIEIEVLRPLIGRWANLNLGAAWMTWRAEVSEVTKFGTDEIACFVSILLISQLFGTKARDDKFGTPIRSVIRAARSVFRSGRLGAQRTKDDVEKVFD